MEQSKKDRIRSLAEELIADYELCEYELGLDMNADGDLEEAGQRMVRNIKKLATILEIEL